MGEGEHADLAHAVAAILPQHMVEIVGIAQPFAEAAHQRILDDAVGLAFLAGGDQAIGGQLFPFDEGEIGPPQAALGQAAEIGPIREDIAQAALPPQQAKGPGIAAKPPIELGKGRPAQGIDDAEHLRGVFLVAQQGAEGTEGFDGAIGTARFHGLPFLPVPGMAITGLSSL